MAPLKTRIEARPSDEVRSTPFLTVTAMGGVGFEDRVALPATVVPAAVVAVAPDV